MTITSEDLIKALEKKEVEIVFNAIKNKETGMI